MRTRTSQRRPQGPRSEARGFTLIELMVVMGIISLLVAIALPAFSAARKMAKRTTTEATIKVLATGLETFHADSAVGGGYPPSLGQYVQSPHTGPGGTKTIIATGANFLVWGLAGADLLGTPGFRDLNNDNGDVNNTDITRDCIGGCTDDTSAILPNGTNPGGLYAVYPMTYPDINLRGKPVQPRSGPYIDLTKVKFPKQVGDKFQLPGNNTTAAPLDSLVFLDAFDQPILYYKANPSAPYMADIGTTMVGQAENNYDGGYGRYRPSGIYNLLDNYAMTGTDDFVGTDLGAGTNHFNKSSTGSGQHPMLGDPTALPSDATKNPRGCFVQHIGNYNVTTAPRPHNPDTYILLSPGPDGLWGTADDIANYPINK